MRQILKQVTITGADDSIPPTSLVGLHQAYPFVEFGILCSKNNTGMPRFPSQEWIEQLRGIKIYPMQLSMHLCGSWVRSLCAGNGSIFKDWISAYFDMFDRIQLNFHQIPHRTNDDKFVAILKGIGLPIIYQMDNVNNRIFLQARKLNLDCSPLYDISGGRGILPKTWIKPTSHYCGYAGGLSPDNLKNNLDKLSVIVGDTPIWIDAETHLRSRNDTVFDIDKVVRFLEVAKPYVMEVQNGR